MQTRDLTAVFVILAMAAGFATASSATDSECISGCETPPPPPPPPTTKAKGNNGWGNGSDMVDGVVGSGTNSGSNSGATQDSKSVDGQGVDKFDGKFEGR